MTVGGPAPAPSPGRRRAERAGRAGKRDSKKAGKKAGKEALKSERAATRDKTKGAARELGSPGMPRISLRGRTKKWAIVAAVLVLLGSWFFWYATTPQPLPRSDKAVNASGVVGTPIYFGMFSTSNGFDRTLRISGVRVKATASADMKITPLLCRQGSIGVTTDPSQFCDEMAKTEGARLAPGDSIMLKVETNTESVALIDQIEIAYREDLTWGTQPAGARQAIVSMTAR